MKIPKQVKIGGLNYKITHHKKLKAVDGGGYADGKTHIDGQTMKFAFDKQTGKEYKEMIFFHELTHLLFYYTGTGEWDNEKEVQGFASVLYQVLKDNNLLK